MLRLLWQLKMCLIPSASPQTTWKLEQGESGQTEVLQHSSKEAYRRPHIPNDSRDTCRMPPSARPLSVLGAPAERDS